jgi:hypothetical protein
MRVARSTKRVSFEGARPNNEMHLTRSAMANRRRGLAGDLGVELNRYAVKVL